MSRQMSPSDKEPAVLVGRSERAQFLNCTDEEAQLLEDFRNLEDPVRRKQIRAEKRKIRGEHNRVQRKLAFRAAMTPLKPIFAPFALLWRRVLGPVAHYTVFDPSLLFILGIIGYWVFGFQSLQASNASVYVAPFRTGILFFDELLNAPYVMWVLSFAMILFGFAITGLGNLNRHGSFLWPLIMVLFMPSMMIGMVWGVINAILFVLIFPFMMSSTAPVTGGMIVLFLFPYGLLVPILIGKIMEDVG